MFIDYAKTAILNHFFKGSVYTQPTHIYVGLSTTDLLHDGSGLTEVSTSGTSYTRVIADSWTISGNQVSNAAAITFAQASGPWGTPIQWFASDAATAGNLLARGPIIYPSTLVPFVAQASNNDLYVPSNPFSNGQNVRFYGQTLPTGVSGNTSYFVISVSADTFQISLTSGGAAVDITADGHGFVGQDFSQPVVLNNTVSFAIGQLVGIMEG